MLDVEVRDNTPAFYHHQDVALANTMRRHVVDDQPSGVGQ
jgi:hypothetical protein